MRYRPARGRRTVVLARPRRTLARTEPTTTNPPPGSWRAMFSTTFGRDGATATETATRPPARTRRADALAVSAGTTVIRTGVEVAGWPPAPPKWARTRPLRRTGTPAVNSPWSFVRVRATVDQVVGPSTCSEIGASASGAPSTP